MIPVTDSERLGWQLMAIRHLLDLTRRAHRDRLPPLTWSVGTTADLVGRPSASRGSDRRAQLDAWGRALGIDLGEHPHQDYTTLTGTVKQRETAHGWCTITLTGDIWPDEEDGADDDH